jgi:5-methylthioadenosine/S-adenosylhomocysteine deaminase
MQETVFYGGTVVTMNPSGDIYEPGWLHIADDRIVGMGPGEPPPNLSPGAKRVSALGKAVLPGIVNIHTHVCGTLFKALTEDNKGSFYGLAFPMERFLDPESTYILSLLGCMETVRFGSTLIHDLYHYMRSTAKAVTKIGLRGILAHKVYEVDLRQLQYNDYSPVPHQGEEKLEENIRLIEEYHNSADGRLICEFGPHATDTVSPELATKIAGLAERYGVGIHIHTAQKQQEIDRMKESYGLTPVEYLRQTGLADGRLTAAHCILVNDSDIRILKEKRVTVAHCPEIMQKRGHFPPAKKFYEQGLRVALGTDWVSMNPWSNMRLAIFGARADGMDEDGINARKAFRMATIGAAECIGMADQIGSLEPGKKADFLLMDLRRPHLQPIFDDILATIVYNATGLEIDDVYIDGRAVVSNGEIVTVDGPAVIDEAAAVAKAFLKRQLGAVT